jgi:hypothetical protein
MDISHKKESEREKKKKKKEQGKGTKDTVNKEYIASN